jgi:hypothetical protein
MKGYYMETKFQRKTVTFNISLVTLQKLKDYAFKYCRNNKSLAVENFIEDGIKRMENEERTENEDR